MGLETVEFVVHGRPGPQGSKTPYGQEASAYLKPWRDEVIVAARIQASKLADAPFTGAVAVSVEFRFAMPKNASATDRARGWRAKTSAPDLDKLQRGVGDGLEQSGLLQNDAKIVTWEASKIEVVGWTGATIKVRRFVP